MIAGAIPKSLRILKNEMMTVAIATTPDFLWIDQPGQYTSTVKK
jgi:hypothetical protein